MARNVKFFHPPHLYCVTTLPSITNTTAIIGVYTSVATSWCRLEYLVWGRQGWSSSILERKLTAHTTAISSSKRVCCLTSEQYVVITGGHCSRMERQRTSPGPRWTIWKRSTSTSLNLTCGLQIALTFMGGTRIFDVWGQLGGKAEGMGATENRHRRTLNRVKPSYANRE